MIVRGMMGQMWLNRAQQVDTTRVSQKKKYGVAYYQYFKNGNTQQCNILWHNKYNFRLCEISTPYVKPDESTWEEWWVKRDLDYQRTNLYTNIILFYHPSPFLPIIPLMVITLVTFDILDWNFTHTSKVVGTICLKILHWYIAPFVKYSNFLHDTFFETPGICISNSTNHVTLHNN